MSVEKRIAEILRDHRERMSQNTAWDECKYCSHHGEWVDHVASVLVDELGLTQMLMEMDTVSLRCYATAWERIE